MNETTIVRNIPGCFERRFFLRHPWWAFNVPSKQLPLSNPGVLMTHERQDCADWTYCSVSILKQEAMLCYKYPSTKLCTTTTAVCFCGLSRTTAFCSSCSPCADTACRLLITLPAISSIGDQGVKWKRDARPPYSVCIVSSGDCKVESSLIITAFSSLNCSSSALKN